MKNQIKELRVKIDSLSQLVKELKSNYEGTTCKEPCCAGHLSKETEKTYDSLILAKAWLGKVLGELGEETPYANDGKRKTVEDIEPAADVYTEYNKMMDFNKLAEETYPKEINIQFKDKPHVEKVDWLREEIQKVINSGPDYVKWVEGEVASFYRTADYSDKQEYHVKEEEFMANLPDLSFPMDLAYKYLQEARFWLGFELQRIRESKNN
jgi:hypothetical protein